MMASPSSVSHCKKEGLSSLTVYCMLEDKAGKHLVRRC